MSDELREAEAWDKRPPQHHFSELTIRNHTGIGWNTDVLLNGAKVPGLRALTVEWAMDDAVVATLEILIDRLDVDTATLAELTAIAKSKAEHGDG